MKRYFNKNGKELHVSHTSKGILITLKKQEPNTISQIMLIDEKDFDNAIKERLIIRK
jgi:hypothetical protein